MKRTQAAPWLCTHLSKTKSFKRQNIKTFLKKYFLPESSGSTYCKMDNNLGVKTSDTYPVLFLSSRLGAKALMYAQVQISSKMTVSKLWKLNMADCKKLDRHHYMAMTCSMTFLPTQLYFSWNSRHTTILIYLSYLSYVYIFKNEKEICGNLANLSSIFYYHKPNIIILTYFYTFFKLISSSKVSYSISRQFCSFLGTNV